MRFNITEKLRIEKFLQTRVKKDHRTGHSYYTIRNRKIYFGSCPLAKGNFEEACDCGPDFQTSGCWAVKVAAGQLK